MIRTRDLVLFAVSVVFLIVAIGFTLWTEKINRIHNAQEPVFVAGRSISEAEVATGDDIDRSSIRARLKSLLSGSASTVEPVPSVTTDADEAAEVAATTKTTIDRCLQPDDTIAKIGLWPLSGLKTTIREGARMFYTETPVAVVSSTGSATTTEMVEVSLLALPLLPGSGGSYCVPSDVIGVTAQGVPIFNNDAAVYKNTGSEQLIGYARDGHPIYGLYGGEVDECGGYKHPAGYRYTIGTDRDFIIGCFTAPPQAFEL